MLKTKDGKLYVIAGASRSGKTAYTLQATRNDARILAWDPEDQFSQAAGFIRVTSPNDLLKTVESIGTGAGRVAYVAGANLKGNFNLFAGVAFYFFKKYGGGTVIAEELADVTTTAKAPDKWGILLRRGLKRGINIYAISQRWAEADKTAIGNASEFVCFRMNGEDIPYMSKKTRIAVADLEQLKTLEYIRFDPATQKKLKKKVSF